MPEWYLAILSARALGVAPWSLHGLDDTKDAYCWYLWGLWATAAEADARASQGS